MKIFKGFKQVAAVTPEQKALTEHGVIFTIDDTGRCWYDIVRELGEENAGWWKFVTDENGLVVSSNMDASTLFPSEGGCVIVVQTKPVGMLPGTAWRFNKESAKIEPYLEAKAAGVIRQRDTLIADTTAKIDGYTYAEKTGTLMAHEATELDKLQAYRLNLIRMDVYLDKVEWPVF